ncbi:MAG: serine/threonine-protein kinase, partial [Cyanobacteria bacterium P01_A01_bin.3]
MILESPTIPYLPSQAASPTLPPHSLLYRSFDANSWKIKRAVSRQGHGASEMARHNSPGSNSSGNDDLHLQSSPNASAPKISSPNVHRYQILQSITKGGFGNTYLACDTLDPDRPKCVIKQLKLEQHDGEMAQAQERFLRREARLLAQLGEHPQIPEFLDSFEADGGFYIVQTFLEGHSVQQLLQAGRRWSEDRTIEFLQHMLSVLQFIHDRGVIHRDIKPSNVILDANTRHFCLIDFGAAKQLIGQWGRRSTVIGSRGYSSPEQMQGYPRLNSDLYALGIVALEMLTGIPAYHLHGGKA